MVSKKRAATARTARSLRLALFAILISVVAIAPVALTLPRLFGGELAAAPLAPAEQPGAEQPGAEQPGAEQPGAEQPGAEQPGAEQPGTGAGEPGANLPPELRTCTTPSMQFIIKERVSDQRLVVTLRLNDITTPGSIKASTSGARQYIDEKLDAEGATTRELDYTLDFSGSGRHTIKVDVVDACGRPAAFDFELATPFIAFTEPLVCVGALDANGYCVVPRNDPKELVIPGASGEWVWDDGERSTGTRSRSFSDKNALVFVQARSFTSAGMRVTPALPYALKANALPRIVTFEVPATVQPDTLFTVSFERPEGAEEAEASIWVDDRQLAVALTAELRLDPGIHTIAFVLAWPDQAGVVTRQAAVVVPDRPQAFGLIEQLWNDPVGQVVLAAIAGLLATLLTVLLVLGARLGYRRSRGLLDGPISPFQAYRLLADGGISVSSVERLSRRRYRFLIRYADGSTEQIEVSASSLRYAWEGLISTLLRRAS